MGKLATRTGDGGGTESGRRLLRFRNRGRRREQLGGLRQLLDRQAAIHSEPRRGITQVRGGRRVLTGLDLPRLGTFDQVTTALPKSSVASARIGGSPARARHGGADIGTE